ncbi:MAG: hypothetical protein HY675_19560 [Chloroflexi bacterium]|nr:hypothetical protein [Chloroflexota bacterium]
MDIPVWLLLVALIVLLSSALVVGLLGLLAYQLVLRAGRGWLSLQAMLMLPGLQRDVAQLRVQLSKEMLGTKRALSTLNASPATKGELGILVRRLERVANALDAQLRLLRGEPSDELLHELLRPARARVDELASASRRIRKVALAVLGGETDDSLRQITADVDREVLALQAGVDELRALTLRELDGRREARL